MTRDAAGQHVKRSRRVETAYLRRREGTSVQERCRTWQRALFAREHRCRRRRPTSRWHLDEMVALISSAASWASARKCWPIAGVTGVAPVPRSGVGRSGQKRCARIDETSQFKVRRPISARFASALSRALSQELEAEGCESRKFQARPGGRSPPRLERFASEGAERAAALGRRPQPHWPG
jgi:hypothetical protein